MSFSRRLVFAFFSVEYRGFVTVRSWVSVKLNGRRMRSQKAGDTLGNQLMHDFTKDVGQSHVAAAEAVDLAFVVNA